MAIIIAVLSSLFVALIGLAILGLADAKQRGRDEGY